MVVYACPAAGERCLVNLFDLYLSKLPSIVFEKEPWYHANLSGNKLSGMVLWMCEKAGLSEHKTNHSLDVTGATSL